MMNVYMQMRCNLPVKGTYIVSCLVKVSVLQGHALSEKDVEDLILRLHEVEVGHLSSQVLLVTQVAVTRSGTTYSASVSAMDSL